jgi:uncharacterized protein (TIGR02246 family)
VNREVVIAMTKYLVAVFLGGALFGGCTSAPPAVIAEAAGGDKAAVESTTAAVHQALRSNDVERFMNYVADDVLFMPPGEPPVRGREAVRQWITRFLMQYRTSNLILADREVFVGGRWAVEVGTFEWALQPAAGGAAVVDRGNYMQVWKQQDDKTWRFAREVYNSSVPIEPLGAK